MGEGGINGGDDRRTAVVRMLTALVDTANRSSTLTGIFSALLEEEKRTHAQTKRQCFTFPIIHQLPPVKQCFERITIIEYIIFVNVNVDS